jgi:hypothetical protein
MTGLLEGAAVAGMVAGTFLAVVGPAAAHPFNVFARSDGVTLTMMAAIPMASPA